MANIEEYKTMLENFRADLANKATNQKIDELVNELKAKDEKIIALEERVTTLEVRLAIASNTNHFIARKFDVYEQYDRRDTMRESEIPVDDNENEKGKICLTKIKDELNNFPNLKCDRLRFDRARYGVGVGEIKKDQIEQVLPRSMVLRLTSWSDRTKIYRARNKVKEEKVKFFIDLTKRRFELKKMAIERSKNKTNVDFVFANVNCNLCSTLKNGVYKLFNSIEELDSILEK